MGEESAAAGTASQGAVLCDTTCHHRPSLPPPSLPARAQDVADACRTGAATDIIFGLALGYK